MIKKIRYIFYILVFATFFNAFCATEYTKDDLLKLLYESDLDISSDLSKVYYYLNGGGFKCRLIWENRQWKIDSIEKE